MHAHIVLAHPESRSYNAHLCDVARQTLEARGWSVTTTDLYAQGFDPCERPEHDGRSGDIELMLWPVNFSLNYAGYTVLKSYVSYGVEAGLRYSDASVVEARLKANDESWARTLQSIDAVPAIPFNTMAQWGADGRIVPGAPVYSPYIRRKKALELE